MVPNLNVSRNNIRTGILRDILRKSISAELKNNPFNIQFVGSLSYNEWRFTEAVGSPENAINYI